MMGIPRSTLLVIFLLMLMAALLGWNYFAKPFANLGQTTPVATASPVPSATPVAETSSVTPESAVSLVLAYPVLVRSTPPVASASASTIASVLQPDDLAWIAKYKPAMVTLFGSQVSSNSAQLATQEIRGVYGAQPVVIAVDHEGGNTQRLNGVGFTALPSWRNLCSQDSTASSTILQTSFAEIRAAGVDMILGPVVDVGTTAVLGPRLCSSDPTKVVENATRLMGVAQSQGLIPVLKHFPGIGSTTRDLHNSFDQVTITANDAIVYQELLNRNPQLAVMVTHVGVSNQLGDIPCSFSKNCVGELKNNYPQSLVIADALEMDAAGQVPGANGEVATQAATLSQRSVAAIEAGNQMLLFGQGVTPTAMTEIYDTLLAKYRSDPMFKTQLDLAAVRVLKLLTNVTNR